jgi:hypothetical protein
MNEQPDLFPLPYVRSSETSKAAAIAAEPNAGTQRWRVLDILRDNPISDRGLTDHEMQVLLDMNPSTQRPRRIELVGQGFVADSGRTRLTPSGKRAVVWMAK